MTTRRQRTYTSVPVSLQGIVKEACELPTSQKMAVIKRWEEEVERQQRSSGDIEKSASESNYHGEMASLYSTVVTALRASVLEDYNLNKSSE